MVIEKLMSGKSSINVKEMTDKQLLGMRFTTLSAAEERDVIPECKLRGLIS